MSARYRLRHRLTALLVVLLAGCAGYSGSNLVPGGSTAAQVRASMGEPAMVVQKPDETWWYYPRGYYARETFVARIGADGVLRGIEQRLTLDNTKYVQIGTSTMNDVRELFGPPHQITRFDRLKRTIWEYRMFDNPLDWLVYVQFSDDGIAREVLQLRDFRNDRFDGFVMGRP
jgi:hypothetical protein